MNNQGILDDAQWERIAAVLPRRTTSLGDARVFVEAVLYVARTGCSWRSLPESWGNWHSIYVRFTRWEASGVWDLIARVVADDKVLKGFFVCTSTIFPLKDGSSRIYKTVRIRRQWLRRQGVLTFYRPGRGRLQIKALSLNLR